MATPIVTLSSHGIAETANVITQAPRFLVTDQQYQQLAAYAPGSRVILNGPGLGTLASPIVTMHDANGTTWRLPIVAAGGDRLEIMLPPPVVDITGGAYIAVEASGTTSYGTLFIDTQDNIPALNGCVSFTTPRKLQFGAGGGSGRILVVGPGCRYAATSSQSFVTITAGAGTAPGNVSFTVGPNPGGARTATIEVAGDVVAIAQAGWGAGAPAAPGAPVVTGSSQMVTFTWTPPATGGQPASYTLVARHSCGGPILVTLPVGAANSFTTTAPNGTFCVSAQATNGAGTGPESPGTSFSVPIVPPPPGTATSLAHSVTGTTVSFNWTAPSAGGAVAQYLLLASVTPGGGPIATLPVSGSLTSVQVTGVPPGTYFVRIVATNAGGSSPASNEVTVVVDGPQTPQPPSLGVPVVGAGRLVTLSWAPGGGGTPTSYTIRVRLAPGGAVIASLPLGAGATTMSATAPPGTYFVSVVAANALGTSAESNQVTVVVP
jgi:hypothetical protein